MKTASQAQPLPERIVELLGCRSCRYIPRPGTRAHGALGCAKCGGQLDYADSTWPETKLFLLGFDCAWEQSERAADTLAKARGE